MHLPEDDTPVPPSLPQRRNREEFDRIYARVYADLRRYAHAMHRSVPGNSDSVSLVHEAYLKLAMSGIQWEDRSHFIFIAGKAMRQILVDRARRELARKRGGGTTTISSDELEIPDARPVEQILEVHEALRRLRKLERRSARVVELRYFLGLEESEIAALLGISERTVRRIWQRAKLFLHQELCD